jgi:hypothetical protein|nr:MAG TPA: hypothetical protein [Caudoviricetes sp.]
MESLEVLRFLDMLGVPSLFVITVMILRYLLKMGAGVQALLRNNLYDLYDIWTARGYAPRDVKANFENLYVWYHSLGKNGVMGRKYEEFLRLPDNPPS